MGGLNHGLANIHHDKTAARVIVDVDHAVRWMDWKPRLDMHPKWRSEFLARAGGLESADHWWVSEKPITSANWVETNFKTDDSSGEFTHVM